jgi:enoyl-CoA hydratase/carnithine racemase
LEPSVQSHETDVTRSDDGSVVWVTLAGGLFSQRCAGEFVAICGELIEDRGVRIVVLGASGDDFCSGTAPDLDRIATQPDPVAALARLRVPVVAAIGGACNSVGLELILASDIRVGHSGASFSIPDVNDGVLPCWGGTQRLPRAIGHARATAMLLLGQSIDAGTAEAWGLLHQVTDDLAGAVDEVVAQIGGNGPLALELAKEAVHRGSELALRDGLRLEGDLNHQLAATDDRAEGLAAFFDKRPPDFAGR